MLLSVWGLASHVSTRYQEVLNTLASSESPERFNLGYCVDALTRAYL